ncbi:hypothetical protein BsWGS_13219 [Bradybaena similaris]
MTNTRQDVGTDVQLKYFSNYHRSTLPHLLAEYGLDKESFTLHVRQEDKGKPRAQTAPRKQKKDLSSFMYADDERIRRRQTERDEYCLKLIQDMQRLRDYYYKEYTRRLAEKVEKQRREIREKDLQSQEKRMKKEEEERRSSHKLKKRLEYHVAETSASSTNLPKTDLYYIVGLEDKLVREGKLKTVNDVNRFRLEIKDPQVFYSTFKVNKHSDVKKSPGAPLRQISGDDQTRTTGMQPLTEDKLAEISHTGQAMRSLSRISEFRESKPDIFGESWAITQQYKKRTSVAGLPSNRRKMFLQSELDRRFPKVEMPSLHCFTMDLATKPPDPVEVQQTAELRAKKKRRKTLMRKIAKMYQLAMSNVATSARILDQHEDMGMLFEGPILSDVIARKSWIDACKLQGSEDADPPDDQSVCQEMIGPCETEHNFRDKSESQREESGSENDGADEVAFSETCAGGKSSATASGDFTEESRSLPTEDRIPPLPLTMEEILNKSKILESKSLSTLWANYMGAGK